MCRYTGTTSEVHNLGSYNYLGFSHADGPCAEDAAGEIAKSGLHAGSTRHENGELDFILIRTMSNSRKN